MFKDLFFAKLVATLGLSLGCGFLGSEVVQAASFQGLENFLSTEVFRSEARSISGDGTTITGFFTPANNNQSIATIWVQNGGSIQLGDASGNSSANGVSSDGSFVVGDSKGRAFRWSEQTGLTNLGSLPGSRFSSEAFDVSGNGSIVIGNGIRANRSEEGFRWSPQTGLVGLGGLPANGNIISSRALGISENGAIIVGSATRTNPFGIGNTTVAVRWLSQGNQVQELGDLPGGVFRSRAIDISADGSTIIGVSSSENFDIGEMFKWTQSTGMIGLGFAPELSVLNPKNLSVSGDGSIIVGRANNRVFIWDETNGMRNLQQLLTDDFGLDLTGWGLLQATGISDDGKTIVGFGNSPDGNQEAWIARLDSVSDPNSPISISPDQPSGTLGEDFLELSNGSSDWFVSIPANSLAGSTTGEQPFSPGGRLWDVPHGTGRSVVNGSNLSISIEPPPELTLNGIPITQGTFNLTSIIAYLANGSEIPITPPPPIFANIGDLTEHLLFDVPLDTEVIHLLGFFDPSDPDLDPANFDITIGPLSNTELEWTFYLPAMTNMTTVQVTDLGNGTTLDDNTNSFLDVDGNTTSVPEPSSVFGLFLITGFGILVTKHRS